MELHQLRYAISVADEGSFTRAAQALHLSQSGVSTQVAHLERELGIKIFERGSRTVTVTEGGAQVVAAMRNALTALDAVRETASDLNGLLRGRVRIGAVAGLVWPPMLDALVAFRERHPAVNVMLREGISAQLQDEVATGVLDLAAVSWAGELRGDLTAWTVLHEQVSVVVAPEHPWAARTSVAPEELVDAELISMTEGTGMRSAFDRVMRARGLGATIRWEVTLPTTVRALAARGLGVGIVTSSAADPSHDAVTIPIESADTASSLGFVWRSETAPPPPTRALLALLRHHVPAQQHD